VLMFSAAEGGWSWWSGNFTNPAGQTVLGLPPSLDASTSYNSSPWWQVSNNPKFGLFPIKATTTGGKHQFLLAQARIRHSGFTAPSLMPINWPVFLGIQAPVEVVKLTNGKHWVTVAGQVINGTGEILDVTHVSVKLKDQNNVTVHNANFKDKLLVDQDVLGQPLDPVLTGPVIASNAPLPKFYDGFEVPRTFKKGKLKVQANVKFHDSKLACYGDARTLDVKLAPVTLMTRLPHDTAVINGRPNSAFRWHWGNGIGGTNFNAHSYPEHRYSYDVVVRDSSNQSFADPAKKDQNDNYYCWGQQVLAMVSGEVLFVANDFEDHFGNMNNPNSKGANMVVVYNDVLDCYQLYVHFKQGSIVVEAGDQVSAGDLLGVIGNSGGSSEPHLHVGISRRDSKGFVRSLPMTFQKIKDGANQTVSGVPADGGFYSEP
jgi:Peptidase family M23